MAIPRSHRPGFFFVIPFLTWNVSDHTTDPVCETRVWSLTSQSKLSKEKPRSDRQWYGHWRFGQKRLLKKWKKPRSMGPWCGHWQTGSQNCSKKNDTVCETVGMASGGLTMLLRVHGRYYRGWADKWSFIMTVYTRLKCIYRTSYTVKRCFFILCTYGCFQKHPT